MNPALVWNGWTNNYVASNDGYIIHAFDEEDQKAKAMANRSHRTRALCGVRIVDSGLLNLAKGEFEPSCFRCQRVLRKAGLGSYLNTEWKQK